MPCRATNCWWFEAQCASNEQNKTGAAPMRNAGMAGRTLGTLGKHPSSDPAQVNKKFFFSNCALFAVLSLCAQFLKSVGARGGGRVTSLGWHILRA
jgi:hypothetical protein